MRWPRKGNHVVMRGKNASGLNPEAHVCLHCGEELVIQLPVAVSVLLAAMRAFIAAHTDCPKPAELFR